MLAVRRCALAVAMGTCLPAAFVLDLIDGVCNLRPENARWHAWVRGLGVGVGIVLPYGTALARVGAVCWRVWTAPQLEFLTHDVLSISIGGSGWAMMWQATILTSALLRVLVLISLRVLFTLGAVVSGFPGLMLMLLVLSWASLMLI